jgi:hypothetical protein
VILRLLARALLLVCVGVAPALAQSPAPPPKAAQPAPPAPKIRRWLDVQSLQFSSRYRWIETSGGRLTSSSVQWQPQIRARFLFDAKARYAVHVGAFSGSNLISGWNNTGAGTGLYNGDFNVKQLFAAAEPVKGLELLAGGLYFNRGEHTEIITYDNDAFLVGERASWRPAKGRLTQVAVTAGYFGDYREPNVFNRFKRMDEWNYAQVLVGFKPGARAAVSVDYTYENGRDIVREAVTFRPPPKTRFLTSIKLEAYQRAKNGDGLLFNKSGAGFNAAGDVKVKRLAVTLGVASVDRYYSPVNGDRYDVGTRFYSVGTYTLTRDVSVGWFQGDAFANDYPIATQHRYEALVTINPTASLKRGRVF